MGDFLDFYDQNQAPGGRIYASFLGRVAMELKELLGDQDAVRELQVRTYQPELDTRYQFPTAQQLHRDNFVEGAEIGIRYLTANRYPTVIPELIKTQPGTIYRTSNKYTLHKRPKYPRSAEEPRALLVINV
jgi:hypothetical protein